MASPVNAITHPIALVAYVLSLVSGLLAKRWASRRKTPQDALVFYLFGGLCALALGGGLLLAWQQTRKSDTPLCEQESSGSQSPNVCGSGDVKIIYNQPPSQTPDAKGAAK
jgi:hypothetical protein